MKKMNRRDFLKLAGLTGGAGILASCSSAAEPEAEEPMGEETGEEVSEAPAAPETVEIVFTGWGGEEEDQGVQDSIEVFEEIRLKMAIPAG